MRKLLSPEICIGLIVGLLTAAVFWCGAFEKYEVRTIDDRFARRGNVNSDAPIVLVGVTDNCLKELGWPIDRGVYADVIDKLFKWKAKSVCLDIFIDERGEEEGAGRLVKAVKDNTPVVLPVVLEKGSILWLPSIDDTEIGPETEHLVPSETFEALKEASDYRGYINVGWKKEINHDGIVRKIPLSRMAAKQELYSFSLLGAATFLDMVKKSDDGPVTLETEALPLWTDFQGQKLHLVNYLKVETERELLAFPFRSLSELAKSTRDDQPEIAGKMIIIGPVFGKTDYYAGPIKPVRGMEIHALISAAIITGDYIRRLPITASAIIIVAFSLLSALILKRFSGWTAPGLVLGILGGAVVSVQALFSFAGIIIEFIPTLAAAAAAAVTVKFYQLYLKLFLANRALNSENRRLTTLYGISSDLSSTAITERRRRLKLVVKHTVEGVQADGGFLLLYDSLTEALVSELFHNLDETGEQPDQDTETSFSLSVGEGVLGTIVLTGAGGIFTGDELGQKLLSYISENSHTDANSLISVPMMLGDRRPVGLINLFRTAESAPFTNNDLALVESVAAQAGGVIENARLYRLATVDGLTGLYVHRHFQTRLEEELRRAIRYDSQLSLMMTDIDHFKKFNDTYGHQIGDFVLKGVANILRDAVRDIDVPARYGGEEFVVILPETDLQGAFTLAERLRKSVETYEFTHGGRCMHVTVSIGVSNYPSSEIKEKEQLIEYADQALYEAKHSGRNLTMLHSGSKTAPYVPGNVS